MEENATYTLKGFLANSVNFPIASDALDAILVKRGVPMCAEYADIEQKEIDLCLADLYMWICTTPNRSGGRSDSDNGWSHKQDSITLSYQDKHMYVKMANDIYERYGEKKPFSSTFKVTNHGIKSRNLDF